MEATNVCTLEEIGVNFEKARKDAGLKDADVADAAGVNIASIGRWKRAEREPGVLRFALAVNRMGASVDSLVFREQPLTATSEALSDAKKANLSRAIKGVVELDALAEDESDPILIFAECVEATLRVVRAKRALPEGTQIKSDGAVTTYDAPTVKRKNGNTAKRMAEAPGQYGMVSEAPAPYNADEKKE